MSEKAATKEGARRAAGNGFTRAALLRLFDSAADAVHVVDSGQRIIYCNRSFSRMLGYQTNQVVGRYCYEVFCGRDYQEQPFCRRDCPVSVAMRRGRGVANYDMLSARADGTPVWLNASVLALRDPQSGDRLGVYLVRDVTQRRRAEILAQQVLEAVGRYQPVGKVEEKETTRGPYPAPAPRLTRREMEVLRLLASGTSVSVMAQTMGIKAATVANHIEHILAKLGVHSRLEAVVYAKEHALV